MKKIKHYFLSKPYNAVIIAIVLLIAGTNFGHRAWKKDKVIEWDIKSYYAYLPAVFIYNDIDLDFRRENIEKFGSLVWPIPTPIGKQAIITTMGMSVLYSPFFFLGHAYALISDHEADGYSIPYKFALIFSVMFYVLMGMIALRKILLRYFSPWVTAFTILAVVVGTNLFYYSTYEAAMSHGYNFALIAWFLLLTIKWHENPGSIKRIMLLGFLAGFITLVRPTNIIILIIFFFWGVYSFATFKERFVYFLKKIHLVGIMALFFIIAWVPQFIYWRYISGMFFFFSYGDLGGSFFWHNPQIFNILLSYKKGWFVYTPIMFIAFLGIFILPWKLKKAFLPILLFKILNIYILASWWSWWFGGGFGLRAFIDSYALMAIPFAAVVTFAIEQRKIIKFPVIALLSLLIWFSYFQTKQYTREAIHYWWMNKEAYWETFLKKRPTDKYKQLIKIPDYELARKGIYVAIDPPAEQEEELPKQDTLDINQNFTDND
jgi:hypothetical protein